MKLLRFALPLLLLRLLLLAAPIRAQLPSSEGAPKVGDKAPDFTLRDTQGNPVKLSDLLKPQAEREKPWVLLVFYRGYW